MSEYVLSKNLRNIIELVNGLGVERLTLPHLHLLKARPSEVISDVGFDNWPGNDSLFQELVEE